MSVEEIRAEVAKLTPEEQAEVRKELFPQPFEGDGLIEELEHNRAEMERCGYDVVSREVYRARLRAIGVDKGERHARKFERSTSR